MCPLCLSIGQSCYWGLDVGTGNKGRVAIGVITYDYEGAWMGWVNH